jgi:hypothetical protein
MFDNVNWNEFINTVLSYVKKNWKYLVIKADITKSSYTAKFYYSDDGKEYIDLYNEIDGSARSNVFDSTIPYLEKITEKFENRNERLFFTVKANSNGDVKVCFRKIADGNKLPFDESTNYLRLSENDKNDA